MSKLVLKCYIASRKKARPRQSSDTSTSVAATKKTKVYTSHDIIRYVNRELEGMLRDVYGVSTDGDTPAGGNARDQKSTIDESLFKK